MDNSELHIMVKSLACMISRGADRYELLAEIGFLLKVVRDNYPLEQDQTDYMYEEYSFIDEGTD